MHVFLVDDGYGGISEATMSDYFPQDQFSIHEEWLLKKTDTVKLFVGLRAINRPCGLSGGNANGMSYQVTTQ